MVDYIKLINDLREVALNHGCFTKRLSVTIPFVDHRGFLLILGDEYKKEIESQRKSGRLEISYKGVRVVVLTDRRQRKDRRAANITTDRKIDKIIDKLNMLTNEN